MQLLEREVSIAILEKAELTVGIAFLTCFCAVSYYCCIHSALPLGDGLQAHQ